MKLNVFQKWAVATTLTTYLLILAGVLVRASGSGLGCPDWPLCFGLWIPPTDVSQLPAAYSPAQFNVWKTWTEFLNRLLGALVGIQILVTLVMALIWYRKASRILWPTLAAFLLVLFQAWLGGQVVKYHLDPRLVTLHLTFAVIIVSLLVYATVCAFFEDGKPREDLPKSRKQLGRWSFAIWCLSLLQVGLGALVRGQIELNLRANPSMPRGEWVDSVGLLDMIHRNVALVLAACAVGLAVWIWRKMEPQVWLRRAAAVLVGMVVVQIGLGLGMAYGGLPMPLQVLHLSNGTLICGVLLAIILLAWRLPPHPDTQKIAPSVTESGVLNTASSP